MSSEEQFSGKVQAYLDGTLCDTDQQALFDEIRRSPEAARRFARAVRMDSVLDRTLRGAPPVVIFSASESLSSRDITPFDEEHLFASGSWWMTRGKPILDHVWGPATALLLHAALLMFILRWTLPPSGSDSLSPLASLVRRPPPLDAIGKLPDSGDGGWNIPSVVKYRPPAVPAVPEPFSVPFSFADAGSVVNPENGMRIPELFSDRSPSGRKIRNGQVAETWGDRADKAVVSGFHWMQARQLSDGSWMDRPVGAVRMAAIAAAAGLAYAPAPTEAMGQFVLRATSFIQRNQSEDGSFDPDPGAHAAALLAVTESRILWRLPDDGLVMDRGIAALIKNVESDYISRTGDAAGAAAAMAWQAHALALLIRIHPEREDLKVSSGILVSKIKTLHDPASGYFRIPGARTSVERTRLMAAAVSALQVLHEGRSIECDRARRRLLRQNPLDFSLELAREAPEHLFFLFDALDRTAPPETVLWLATAAHRVLSLQGGDGGWCDGIHSPDLLLTASSVIALSAHYRYGGNDTARTALRMPPVAWADFFVLKPTLKRCDPPI